MLFMVCSNVYIIGWGRCCMGEDRSEELATIRGKIISDALVVESGLDDIISLIFMGKNLESAYLFKEMLLDKEFFTFMNKWKLFREFTKRGMISFESDLVRKEVLTLIKRVIDVRDHFAHGSIDVENNFARLTFIEGGEKKTVILSDEYFSVLKETFDNAVRILNSINEVLKNKV